MSNRKGPWKQTFTGKAFYPLDPRPEDICIEDIAHALSLTLEGLLHDAPEAYLYDIVRPDKELVPVLVEAEDRIMEVIRGVYGLRHDLICHKAVKDIDDRILMDERAALMSKSDKPWEVHAETLGIRINYPWVPGRAEERFLERFHELWTP